MAATGAVKRLVRGPAKAFRKALFPDYEVVLRDIRLTFDSLEAAHRGIADLQVETAALRSRLDEAHLRIDQAQGRIDEAQGRLDEALPRLTEGLLEERRLNLRIAELTDLVTEIVLPLHDRDIDPQSLQRLAPDTL
jgi:chromosome segregation ATPase